MVIKVKGGYKVRTEKGKTLPKVYKEKEEAEKRIKTMKMFKHMKKKK